MPMTATQALAKATLYSDEQIYRFVTLPPNAVTAAAGIVAQAATPFMALLVDKDEVTLMLEDEDYHEYQKRMKDHQVSDIRYRLITFDLPLEPNLVGFMALVSAALAEASISIMPFAAYARDHIFVPEEQFEQALDVLRKLQATQ